MGTVPSYRRVYLEIKREIKDGIYKPGTLLPTESELEEKFSVSRTTIRKAVSMLVADGYIRPKQGFGTEVLDFSTTQKLNYITSITETLQEKGHKVTTKGMSIKRIQAPDYVADALRITAGSTVYMVQRVQWADNQPIAIMVNYLRENAVPGLEKYTGTFTGLYAFLEKQYNIVLQSAWERISAASADFAESQILQIPVDAPVLCSKRISYTEQGPIEYSIIKLVGDKYEYSVYLQGRR
jgi:Transcriptional regulators